MTNPIIETDLAVLLDHINNKLDGISTDITDLKVGQTELKGEIKNLDEKLSGQIKAVDERLSGQIKAVDERLSGQIKSLDTKVEQIDKRVGNQEFLNRGIFIGLLLALLGGLINILGWIPKN